MRERTRGREEGKEQGRDDNQSVLTRTAQVWWPTSDDVSSQSEVSGQGERKRWRVSERKKEKRYEEKK